MAWHAAGGPVLGEWSDRLLNDGLAAAVQAAGAAAALARGLSRRRGRSAGWLLVGAGLVSHLAGTVLWNLLWARDVAPPFPSPADWLWLAMYPLVLVGLVLVVRPQLRGNLLGPWVDGLLGALAVGALAAVFLLDHMTHPIDGGAAAMAVNLTYPALDLLLLGVAAGYVSLRGWRIPPGWVCVAAGVAALSATDVAYRHMMAHGDAFVGTVLNCGWGAAALAFGVAGWLPHGEHREPAPAEGPASVLVPAVLSAAGITVLIWDHVDRVNHAAVGLAAASLVVALARTALAFRENLELASARRQALHDDLTGLPNRRGLLAGLRRAMVSARARDGRLAVMMIDLDRFKDVNDSLGHHAGDDLLRVVASRLEKAMRPDEVIARFGGDEFCVLVEDVPDAAAARAVAARLLAALSAPVSLDGLLIHVEASVGVALFPDHGADESELLRRADVAMYQAKGAGGAGYALYHAERDPNSRARLALIGQLREALDSDQVEVHFQPRVDLRTGTVRGAEALVRWRHPTLGLVPPAEFVPAAERSSLIAALTARVLDRAVRQARRWHELGWPISVSVNLSPRNLHDPRLVDTVAGALARWGLPPDRLELEITETTLMVSPERARRLLDRLRGIGVRVSIDDFGTGLSSLAYVASLPISAIKIDRSFLRPGGDRERARAVATAAIELAERLDLVAVAEGVEDQETARWLLEAGCPEAQGYLFGRPMGAGELEQRWLSGAWRAAEPASPLVQPLA